MCVCVCVCVCVCARECVSISLTPSTASLSLSLSHCLSQTHTHTHTIISMVNVITQPSYSTLMLILSTRLPCAKAYDYEKRDTGKLQFMMEKSQLSPKSISNSRKLGLQAHRLFCLTLSYSPLIPKTNKPRQWNRRRLKIT